MKKIDHLMVGLDLNPLDERLLSFAREFGRMLQVKKVTGAHIIPAILISNVVKVAPGKLLRPIAPAVGKIEEEVQRLTTRWFKKENVKFGTKVLEGRPFQEIMKMISTFHVDLLVLGKKKDPYISRMNAKKVARQAPCDLLIVPEDTYADIKKIVVAIDFSVNGAKAIERALSFADHPKVDAVIDCVHIIAPLEKYPFLLDRPTILEQDLTPSTRDIFREFKNTYQFPANRINYNFYENRTNSVAGSIHEYATGSAADLIVLGAQGHNWTDSYLFGSVTEAMVEDYFGLTIYVAR